MRAILERRFFSWYKNDPFPSCLLSFAEKFHEQLVTYDLNVEMALFFRISLDSTYRRVEKSINQHKTSMMEKNKSARRDKQLCQYHRFNLEKLPRHFLH